MTTDPLARVAELEKATRKMIDAVVHSVVGGRGRVQCALCLATAEGRADLAHDPKCACAAALDALTGTGDDVLAVVEAARDLDSGDLQEICGMLPGNDSGADRFKRKAKALHDAICKLDTPAAPTDGWIEWKGGASADDIRAQGWAVAVHNDYRLDGNAHTFWLFTKGDRAIKGEGLTDAEALNEVRARLANPDTPKEPG